jgi:alpha-mannosidase
MFRLFAGNYLEIIDYIEQFKNQRVVPVFISDQYSRPLFSIDATNLIVDTIKKCEDSDSILVRLYEAYGGRVTARLKSRLKIKAAWLTNLLEDLQEKLSITEDGSVLLVVKPFQIVSVKVELA